jgi:hypothetical protein
MHFNQYRLQSQSHKRKKSQGNNSFFETQILVTNLTEKGELRIKL